MRIEEEKKNLVLELRQEGYKIKDILQRLRELNTENVSEQTIARFLRLNDLGTRKNITTAQKEIIRGAYEEGFDPIIIAEVLDKSSKTILKHLKDMGCIVKQLKVTDEEKLLIKELKELEISNTKIAETLNRSRRTISKHLGAMGYKSIPRATEVTEEEKKLIRELRNSGLNTKGITAKTGRSETTVRKYSK